ncbi:MAG: DNA-3-methyladenine glycosylase [Longimicrobiales bacterium]
MIRAVDPAGPCGDAAAEPIGAGFFARPAEEVARALLGRLLVSTVDGVRTAGRIVETEAYVGPHDPASHAAERIGRTARNRSMFGPPGHAYVYRIYGLHWCMNAVTGEEGFPSGVLIRAIEPTEGIGMMRERRGGDWDGRRLTGGPARLTVALGITGALDGASLDRPPLWISGAPAPVQDAEVVCGPRIGVTRAADWPLRFHLSGCRWVSH